MPAEIIAKIMSEIPGTAPVDYNRPFSHNAPLDCSALLPITHTCHRLREVAIGHRALWCDVSNWQHSLTPLLVERSAPAPLRVWSSLPTESSVASYVFLPDEAYRLRELHILGIMWSNIQYLFDFLRNSQLPQLEWFSLHGWQWEELGQLPQLPLSCERSPRLRRMTLDGIFCLPETGFPLLTHIALLSLSSPDAHLRIVEYLAQCPGLETVALGVWTRDPPEASVSTSKPLLLLPKLQRVEFHRMGQDSLRFYFPRFPSHVAYDIFDCSPWSHDHIHFLFDYLVPPQLRRGPLQLCVSRHPDDRGEIQYSGSGSSVALTVSVQGSTRRVAGDDRYNDHSWTTIRDLLSFPGLSEHVQEVWMVNFGTSFPWPRHPKKWDLKTESPLIGLASLETIVLVVDHTWHIIGDQPSLHLLPSSSDPAFAQIGPTTLRIAHGYSDYAHAHAVAKEQRRKELPTVLDFTLMMEDLATGSYTYLKHLVLQTTPHIRVFDADVARLQDHFETVHVEQIEELPCMPSCVEDPARKSCIKYPGALW